VAGFKMPTSPTTGHVLTSDGTGVGTWQAPAFDFSDGGEAGGMDRTLGNTDGFSLGLLTGNTTRIHIASDGKVGVSTTTPKSALQVDGGIQLSDDTDAASADKVGTFRYRTLAGSPNKSFLEMCMQTGASTYEWVIIKENSW
jgi:hypothetical protein